MSLSKEKLVSLTKYQQSLKDRLTSVVPAKHVNHPKHYKLFLQHELDMVTKKLNDDKLERSEK